MGTLSLKISDAEEAALDLLSERHKCNRSEACRQAILAAVGGGATGNSDTKIDVISATLQELLSVLNVHVEASQDISRRTIRIAAQGAFHAARIAEKQQVLDESKNDYRAWLDQQGERVKI
jgi:hypothetical protein